MILDESRRIEERVTINQEFESLESFLREYVANISRSGAFIRCPDPLPIGTRVRVKFLVIDEDLKQVEGEGEVIRVQNDPPGMGVLFSSLDAQSAALLELLLERAKNTKAP
ncbi:MAG: PilZ domain-containing protein [Deltaproteobacteria bacterium]|nr:PilZ domain-containing protein [Deltaproteobacteria bacterium]